VSKIGLETGTGTVSATPFASGRDIELTILMPCLNEAETIGACINNARSFLDRTNTSGEVLVADNGSTDGSQAIAGKLHARVIDVAQKGYGAALRAGIADAQGQYVIMGDADDSYDFAQLDLFLHELRNGNDLVMGNRFRGGIQAGAMPLLHKYLGNPVLSFLGRLFFHIKIGDFHCGLRGFRTDSIRRLELLTLGMEFASEMIVRAAIAGLRIKEVPTTLRPDGRSRAPHLRTWRDGWRHLKFLLMYSPRWLFIIPGIMLVSFGSFVSSITFFGPFYLINDVMLDLNTFTFACFLIMLGVQLLTFGGLSRYYASVTGMLPMSRRATALVRNATVDKLIWIAAVLFVAGAGLFGAATHIWASHDFGPLTDPLVPRLVIAGMTLLVISVQMFFSGFLFGILGIPFARG